MKKLFYLFVPMLTLFFILAPQRVWATPYDDVSTYIVQPFTIEKMQSADVGYIKFYGSDAFGTASYTATRKVTINLQYRIATDGGDYGDWTTVATAGTTTVAQLYSNSITLSSGHTYKVQFKGNNPDGFNKSSTDYYQIAYVTTSTYASNSYWVNMYGNIMSLIKDFDTDNLAASQATLREADVIPNAYCFYRLLTNYTTSAQYMPAVDASNLIFPATKLTDNCYNGLFTMFNYGGCTGGIIYGPTFLATDFITVSETATTGAFNSMFTSCSNLKAIRLNFTTCPSNTNNTQYWMHMITLDNLYAPAEYANCANNNISTNSKTTWSYDPSAEPGGGDEPGGGGGESITPASVDVYQAATTDRTEILYDLPANAVDLGTGVAWATTDYDASTASKFAADTRGATGLTGAISGNNCSCDPRTQITQNVWYAYSNITPPANWRMPTQAEYEDLTENNTSVINLGTDNKRLQVYSRISNDNIQFSSVGYVLYGCGNYDWWEDYCYYYDCSWQDINIPYYWITQNSYFGINTSTQVPEIGGCDASCMMPARFVYNPSFATHTLTITAGEHQYTYICQEGQEVTVTVVPQTSYVFDKWSDNDDTNATRTFTMYDNVAVEAIFKIDPSIPQHTATFVDWDEKELDRVETYEGFSPVYSGEEPEREGYEFIGWTPAIAPMGDEDVVYTATYKKISLFTITNTHATQAMTVYLKRAYDNNYVPKPTVYVRITDANGNITYNWTAKQITGNSNVNVAGSATIPAGGKMEIYGNNTGFCSASNNSNNCKFVISGGTAKLSGNLLSLVACSDGKTVNNDFTMPTNCFYYLFGANSVIVSAEDLELPSITLSQGCYWYMFFNCTGLVKAPKKLPATVMPPKCYYQMFQGCTALTRSPDIYGQTLTGTQNSTQTGAEASMFSGCTNLSHIRTYLATQWTNQTYHTSYWVNNVQKVAGSFYCPRTLDRITGGSNFIPSNWTIYSYNVTFVPVGGNWSDDTNENKQFTWRTDVSDVTGFMTEQTERVVGYYKDAQCTIEITDINAILTERPSDDNTTYIYAKMALTTNYYNITISTDPASGYGTVNTSSMNDVEEGTAISTSSNTLTIGTTIITATKTADDAQYTYAFTGWTDNSGNALPATITEDLTIRANFTRTLNTYTVTWKNGEDVIETDTDVPYGETPSYDGETPTKTAAGYTYTFSGWSPTITTVTGNTTYTATFDAVAATTLDLYDNRDAAYYNNIKALNGQTYDVTYHRSVAYTSDNGNARWYTLCLPFKADQSQLAAAGMLTNAKIYEYRYAEGSADENDHVTFHFRAATSIIAGRGYLVKATGDMGPDFTFTGVTLNTSADVVNGNVDNLKNSNAYKESGDIAIVGVLRNDTLSAAGKQVMGLANNKIWYPHSSGNPMPAYRAYFYNPNASPTAMPRVRIVVEGEGTTELEVVDGELYDARGNDADGDGRAPRKYIRNGVLIIERNGIRYDAQGKRL